MLFSHSIEKALSDNAPEATGEATVIAFIDLFLQELIDQKDKNT